MELARPFADRRAAGRALAKSLAGSASWPPSCLRCREAAFAVAAEIAHALKAPLEIVVVRKIGVPWQPELAVAAVVDGGKPEVVMDDETSNSPAEPETTSIAEASKQARGDQAAAAKAYSAGARAGACRRPNRHSRRRRYSNWGQRSSRVAGAEEEGSEGPHPRRSGCLVPRPSRLSGKRSTRLSASHA